MFRLNVESTDSFATVIDQLMPKVSATDEDSITITDKANGEGAQYIINLAGKTVGDLALKNGDMLYLNYEKQQPMEGVTSTVGGTSEAPDSSQVVVSGTPSGSVAIQGAPPVLPVKTARVQLPIDDLLDKEKGLISRPRSYMCRHGDKGMCEYCSPLPPWDKNYQKEKGYKHLSFHAYVKEIDEQKNSKYNSTSYMAPLEEPNYYSKMLPTGVRQGPAVITLQQQKFRMVDNVEFSDSSIMNKFIDVWRNTGVQRFGYMYGRYEQYDVVPLGIKAVVEAIYEPPQADEVDGITLLPWEDEQLVDEIASRLGLVRVGVIFTDLTDLGMKNGTVLCKRHKDTYFLSCIEIMMAAKNQIKNPNVTKHSSTDSLYLSKFVTCVISGGLKGEIEPRSYQVSVDAEALVRADIITSTTQPSMLYVNESEAGGRLIPDIYFLKINEYGLEVKTNAKPTFPVEFLLVSLSDSFPKEPNPKFKLNFNIENRYFMGDLQDLKSAYKFLNGTDDTSKLIDFHFIIFLLKMDILGKEEKEMFLKFAQDGEYEDYLRLVESPGWMTLVTILEQSS